MSPPGDDGLYKGPLFDTHVHLSRPLDSRFGSANALCDYLEKHQVLWAIGFYFVGPVLDSWARTRLSVVQGAQGRVVPLLQPSAEDFAAFAGGKYTDGVLRSFLQPQGHFQGVGEIPLYRPLLQEVTFESPVMETAFRAASQAKGIVMIHPNEASARMERDSAQLEAVVAKYPNVIFLFHGSIYARDLILPLMAKYPNVYYTVDAATWMFGGRSEGNLMVPRDGSAGSNERFLADVQRVGIEPILEESLQRTLPWLQQYPERILWGTDRFELWHFDEPATQLIMNVSRRFIGRLPVDLQEKYAFRNALRVFGPYFNRRP